MWESYKNSVKSAIYLTVHYKLNFFYQKFHDDHVPNKMNQLCTYGTKQDIYARAKYKYTMHAEKRSYIYLNEVTLKYPLFL